MAGGVVSRYCNICNRIITPREIETGQAIIYGTHCYCAKCKEEVMPIIEAIKRRFEEANKKEEAAPEVKATVEQEATPEVGTAEVKRISRYKTPLPFRLQHRPSLHHTKDVGAKTELFLKRPALLKKKREIQNAVPTAQPVAQPSEVPVAQPIVTAHTVAHPPSAPTVTEDGLLVEPVSFDSPNDTEKKEPSSAVLEKEDVPVVKEVKSPPHPKPAPHPPPHKTELPLPRENIVVVHQEKKPPSKAMYLILVLVILIVAGGLGFYYGYYLPEKEKEEKQKQDALARERQERARKEREIIEALNKQVLGVSSFAEYEASKKALDEAETGLILLESKNKIADLRNRLTEWLGNEIERVFNEIMNRYKIRASMSEAKLSELLEVLKSYPEQFAQEPLAKNWINKLKEEKEKVEATQQILNRFEELQLKIAQLEEKKEYKEALKLLDTIQYSRDKVLERFLKPLAQEKGRIERMLAEYDKAAADYRNRAKKAYESLLTDVERGIQEHNFEKVKQMLKEFWEKYPDTGVDREARTKFDSVVQEERKWILANIFNGTSTALLRIQGKDTPKLHEKILKVEPETEDTILFFGFDDSKNIEAEIEFILIQGSFKFIFLAHDDKPETGVQQEVKYPLVELNQKMRVSVKTAGETVVVTFLHKNMKVSLKSTSGDTGSLGIIVPVRTKLHIVRISIVEK